MLVSMECSIGAAYTRTVEAAGLIGRADPSMGRPLVTVDKTREEWKMPEVEIVFDHVEGAGTFVEFEFKGDAENVAEATARLDEFIASLDLTLGELVTRGYPHILLGRQH